MSRAIVVAMVVTVSLAVAIRAVRAQAVSSPPVGYWNFDNANAADLSGNGLNGTLNGGAGFSSDVPPQVGSGMSLQLTTAATVDASSDFVDLGNPSILDFAGDFTVAGWIKTDQAARGNFFSKGGDDGGGIRYVLAVGEVTAGLVTLTTDDNVTKAQANGTTSTNDGAWHHVAAVREGTAIRVYRDGVEEGANTVPAGYDLSGASQQNAYIGVGYSQANSALLKQLGGLYDDVAVWNVALSASDITGLANGTLSVISGGGAPVLGDFNSDGVVNNADYVILSDNLAGHLDGPVGRDEGDINFDGKVDLDDFGQFKELFPGALGQGQAIPEPSSVAILLAALTAIVLARRR